MNVAILSSTSEMIDPYYLSITRSIAHYLASNELDLVYGGGASSMMEICYQEFASYNRTIYSFTTEKYIDLIPKLPKAKHYIKETTFDMKKGIFENADLIVALPGGIGTISEIFAFVEENRSNDKEIPIIIYDENNDYQYLFQQLNVLKEKGFISNFSDWLMISHNQDEFKQIVEQVINEKGEKRK